MNENNNTRKEQQEDDGSLSFLAIGTLSLAGLR